MKKVVLSLIIGGLSISGDCFAAHNNFDRGSKQHNNGTLQPVKGAWSKVKSNTKKVIGNKKFKIAAIGTAGAAVAAYYYSPSFAGFVNSNAEAALDLVKNSDQYELVSSKWTELSKTIGSSKFGNVVKGWLGVEPASTKWEKFGGRAKDALNSIPAWAKWSAVGGKAIKYSQESWYNFPEYVRNSAIFVSFMGGVYLYLVH